MRSRIQRSPLSQGERGWGLHRALARCEGEGRGEAACGGLGIPFTHSRISKRFQGLIQPIA